MINPFPVVTKRDYLRVAELSPLELEQLLDLAGYAKAAPLEWHDALRGQSVACYFAKPSTRTRVSFEDAAWRLGALPIMLRPDELQLGRGEPISDTARVLSSYCAAIVIRTFDQSDVEEMARWASVPVVNALTDDHHPCQALADLLTLREHFGDLEGLRLAFVGDGSNNVARSLLEAGALAGMEVVIGCPVGYEPDQEVLERTHGTVVHDAHAAGEGAHAVYTDVWVSMGDDAERERRLAELRRFSVVPSVLAAAREDAVFLHCLPAHRGEEVATEVIDGPQSLVFEQAANRLPTEQAVLYALTTGRWEAER